MNAWIDILVGVHARFNMAGWVKIGVGGCSMPSWLSTLSFGNVGWGTATLWCLARFLPVCPDRETVTAGDQHLA